MEKEKKEMGWKSEWEKTKPILEQYKSELEQNPLPRGEVKVMKVNQLDSIALDEEIHSLLRAQLFKCFKLFKRSLLTEFKPEISAILDLLVFKFSVYDKCATYGQTLQNLVYVDGYGGRALQKWQKVAFGLLWVGLPYVWERLSSYAAKKRWAERPQESWQKKANEWMNVLEKVYKALSLANFLFFFYEAKYVSLLSRVLGMRLVYSSKNVSKSLSFEFMNRQLVWSGFTEFLLVLLPLVNLDAIKAYLVRNFVPKKILRSKGEGDTCAICLRVVETPYLTSCGHTFCYYCIKTESIVNSPFHCPECGKQVSSIKRKEYE